MLLSPHGVPGQGTGPGQGGPGLSTASSPAPTHSAANSVHNMMLDSGNTPRSSRGETPSHILKLPLTFSHILTHPLTSSDITHQRPQAQSQTLSLTPSPLTILSFLGGGGYMSSVAPSSSGNINNTNDPIRGGGGDMSYQLPLSHHSQSALGGGSVDSGRGQATLTKLMSLMTSSQSSQASTGPVSSSSSAGANAGMNVSTKGVNISGSPFLDSHSQSQSHSQRSPKTSFIGVPGKCSSCRHTLIVMQLNSSYQYTLGIHCIELPSQFTL